MIRKDKQKFYVTHEVKFIIYDAAGRGLDKLYALSKSQRNLHQRGRPTKVYTLTFEK